MSHETDHSRPPGAAETEQFMAVAAHDLRNPIAVVKASAQMAQRQLRRGDLDAAQGRLAAIVEQSDRLTEMLESFVDAARISAGALKLRTEKVELRELVVAAEVRARALIGDHIQRTVELSIEDGLVGTWDRARMIRAIRALLANAFLYGDAASPVQVSAVHAGGRVQLRVCGFGPGPDVDEQQHLFEQFFRGRSAADAGQSGSGLGLFTARGIAREHGGEVRRIERDVFELEVPLAAAQS
ncbi:MAG: HAMP domain-containing histidine kinase [Chloroflexi bacterium]|nr:HAMP domain-containing histidine kinase [Chloroflexota bacterium]